MQFRALLTILALSIPGSTVVHADTFVFSFGASGDPIAGSGVLQGTLTSPGVYSLTGIEGTTRYAGSPDLSITTLLPGGSFLGNDNLLTLTNAGYKFDLNGLSYELSDDTDINLFTDSSPVDEESFQTSNNTIGSEYVPYVVTVTPEPTSLVLLGTGLFGAFGIARRRLRA